MSRSTRSLLPSLALAALAAGSPLAGQTSTSAQRNPTYTFTTPGVKQVSFQACNSGGCTTVTKTVVVLDPTPVIDASAVSPLSVEAGQLFRLTATGHGQPSLAFTWGVASASAPSTSQPGANTWWDTSGFAPGVYVITLQLTNPITTVASLPVAVTVRPEQGADFYTVIPCRVADTRMGMGGSSMAAGTARTLAITGPACGIPDGAKAVSVNVTAANPTGQGELAVYPGNYPAPGTTVVAFAAGQNRATAAILPLASDGTGTLAAAAAMTGTGSVDVIVDVNGYFL